MKKFILAGAAAAALASSGVASAVVVSDPTPNGAFTGTYTYSCTVNGQPSTCTGTQKGYVSADQSGVVACNGQAHPNSSGAGDLQGYVWVGSANQASNPVGSDPTGNVGAGSNKDASGNGAPCPQQP